MRPVRAVGLFLLFVFLGGALLAPWVYKLVQACALVFPPLHSLAAKPFARYLGRCFMLLAIVGLKPLLTTVELSSWRAVGLAPRLDALNRFAKGFLVGFISMAVVVVIALAAGARVTTPDLSVLAILGRCLKAALTAALIAPLEELFFRAALFGALRKTFHWALALVLSSVVYATLHFLDRTPEPSAVTWSSGLAALGAMAGGFTDGARLFPGLLNLTLVGVILGLAYQRSSSLHFSIGLHAGWVFWLKTYGAVTDDAPGAALWFFGTHKLINGWLASIILAVVFALICRLMIQEDPQTHWKERRLFS